MFSCCFLPKKLGSLAGEGPASEEDGDGNRRSKPVSDSFSHEVTLEQLWSMSGSSGIRVHNSHSVSVLACNSVFLPPKQWTRVYLPYKVSVVGGVTLTCGLSRVGLVAGLAVTKGGQLRVNVWNATDETVQLTPKTVMVNVLGARVRIKRHGKEPKFVGKILVNKVDGEFIKNKIVSSL